MQTWGYPSAFDFVDNAPQGDMRTAAKPRDQFVEIQHIPPFFSKRHVQMQYFWHIRGVKPASGGTKPARSQMWQRIANGEPEAARIRRSGAAPCWTSSLR
jgi:hypothetical protein